MIEEKTTYILFAKKPEAWKVKTRLAEGVGAASAVRLYQAFLEDILFSLNGLHRPFAVAYTPAGAGEYFEGAAGGAAELFPQQGRDLGERMNNAFLRQFALGYDKVILIGSDIPLLSPEILEEARSALTDHPVVLGPCRDGGYYLIGLRKPVEGLFSGISWGSDTVFRDTISILRRQRCNYRILPELSDVDRADDLEQLNAELKSRNRRGHFIPENTRQELSSAAFMNRRDAESAEK
jgi:uncharacterized protein